MVGNMNPIDEYIKNGYEVYNALVENADITTEEFPSVDITLTLPIGHIVFGGYTFGHSVVGDFNTEGWDKGMTAIFRIMEVAGVKHWSRLKGSPIRAILKDQRIYAIAHFLEDKVLDYRLAPFQEKTSL